MTELSTRYVFLTHFFCADFFQLCFCLFVVEQLFPCPTTAEARRRRCVDHVGLPHRRAAYKARPQGQVRAAQKILLFSR